MGQFTGESVARALELCPHFVHLGGVALCMYKWRRIFTFSAGSDGDAFVLMGQYVQNVLPESNVSFT